MYIDYLDTPLGLFEIMATEHGICQGIFCGEVKHKVNTSELTKRCKQQLIEYFAKKRTSFTLPLDSQGTEFQKAVWQCLTDIPYGAVFSYGDIAKRLNKPKASQAVGGANGRNPLTIIVPCHRVIGTNGSLTGYAGGLERKLWLLEHEGIVLGGADKNNLLTLQKSLKDNLAKIKEKRQEKTNFLR